MKKYTAKNERIKETYYRYLAEVDGRSTSTIDGICKSIVRFEEYNNFKDFATFNKEQAVGFKKRLLGLKAERTGEALSKATTHSTIKHLQAFFKWLAMQEGYKSKISPLDISYFNLTSRDVHIAQSRKLRDYPSLEQIRATVLAMPSDTDIQKRDRALLAFAIASGARDSAIISLKLKHLDTHNQRVTQYPDEVKTKRSKTIITGFFPIGDDFKTIVLEWVEFLTREKLFSPNDPLFPKTAITLDASNGFTPNGISQEHWNTTAPVCKIFRQAFEAAGLPYFNPHSFRHTLGHMAQTYCATPEEFKAWSQNLGHESVLTTLGSYGQIDPYRQCEVIKRLGKKETEQDKMDVILQAIRERK
jgi:integrase/recombinase XerD